MDRETFIKAWNGIFKNMDLYLEQFELFEHDCELRGYDVNEILKELWETNE